MALTSAARLRLTLLTSRGNKEVFAGECACLKIEVIDSVLGTVAADGDVGSITVSLYDKVTKKYINGRSSVSIGSPLATKYVGLNPEDNVVVSSAAGARPSANSLQTHVLRVTVGYTGPGGGVDSAIEELEFSVRNSLTPAT